VLVKLKKQQEEILKPLICHASLVIGERLDKALEELESQQA